MQNIIFDLDGTLSDSAIITEAAFKETSLKFGLKIPSLKRIRSAIGFAEAEFYHVIYPDNNPEIVKNLGDEIEKKEIEILKNLKEDIVFSGCRELLDELIKRKYRLFIASTGSHDHVNAILDKAEIRNYFHEIHCAKPNKQNMIKKIIGNDNSENYIMVGDMKKDSEGARANNIISVGACYGYCILEKNEFDYYINTPADLLNIISEIKKRKVVYGVSNN